MMNSRDENLLKVARRLCYSDIELPLSECFRSKRKSFCKNSNKCEIEKLNDKQLEYIVSDLECNTFLSACPGSGKTEVVGIKAAYEISNWTDKSSGLAILTFSRNAAKEIKDRVLKYTDSKADFPHYIGTIDSWLHSFILHPFGHLYTKFKGVGDDKSFRLVDETSEASFLNAFKTKYAISHCNVAANNYYYSFAEDKYIFKTNSFPRTLSLNALCLEDWQINDINNTKDKFYRNGFCTYQDAEYIIINVLYEYKNIAELISKRFNHIIIDECQDLSYEQLIVFDKLLKSGTKLHFVGDINQSIYEFRKVNPDDTIAFMEKYKFSILNLSQNYRSNQRIVDICSKIISADEVKGNEDNAFDNAFQIWTYSNDDELKELPNRFSELLDKCDNTSKEKSIILARSKDLLRKINPSYERNIKNLQLLANSLTAWNKEDKMKEDIDIALKSIGKFLNQTAFSKMYCNGQQYSCPEGFDYIEWRFFLSDFLDNLINLDWDYQDLTYSKWISKINKQLQDHWNQLFEDFKNYGCYIRLRSPSGKTNSPVSELFGEYMTNSVFKLSTIHKVKGQTYDAVLLISSKDRKSKGGHWKQWIESFEGDDQNSEYKRIGYVASSRPKYLLIWAIPKNQEKDCREMLGL